MAFTLQNNIRNIYWMVFFQSTMIIIAVFVPLLQQYGLTMSQVLQTQALFALVVAICEVPSGYLADLWGRKNTILIGQGIIGFSYFWLLTSSSFIDFMIYEALMGVGISLSSGADLALLYDTQTALDEQGKNDRINHGNHISRLVAVEGYGGAVSGIAASLLTLLSLEWVLWAQCIVGLITFGLSLCLVEAPRRISAGSHQDNIGKIYRKIFHAPLVLWTSLSIIVFGLIGLYGFWVLQKYWELQSIPVAWFGYLWAGHCVVRGLIAHYAYDIEQLLGWRKILLISAILPVLGFTGMGLLSGWAGILCSLGLIICRGLSTVVFYDALNKRVDSDFRATVNSLVSLGVRSVFILTGPILGLSVDNIGVNATLLSMAGLIAPVIFLVLFFLARTIRQEEYKVSKEETDLEKQQAIDPVSNQQLAT